MKNCDTPGRATAAAVVRERWGLAPNESPDSIRQSFLKKVAAGDFEIDPRLVGEFVLLSNAHPDTSGSLRLVADQERLQLAELGALLSSEPKEFAERSAQLEGRLESPFSAAWFFEIRAAFEHRRGSTPGGAFGVQDPPAKRRTRPSMAAFDEIARTLGWMHFAKVGLGAALTPSQLPIAFRRKAVLVSVLVAVAAIVGALFSHRSDIRPPFIPEGRTLRQNHESVKERLLRLRDQQSSKQLGKKPLEAKNK